MKVDIHSQWDSNKRKPNVYLYLVPENETETALMRALYGVRPKFIATEEGKPFLDFFPDGEKK